MLETTEVITKETKLVRALGGGRIVHAIECSHIANWDIEGLTPLNKFNPKNMNTCNDPICNILVHLSLGAKDYDTNRKKYLSKFLQYKISAGLVQAFYIKGRAKTEFYGNIIYIHSKKDDWKIEFCLDGNIKLWHNNYQTAKRKDGQNAFAAGYHEHELMTENKLKEEMNQIIRYDFKEANKVHEKKNKGEKKRKKMTLKEIAEL